MGCGLIVGRACTNGRKLRMDGGALRTSVKSV